MLFERKPLTPQGRMQTLESIFEQVARRPGETPAVGRVPLRALEAYGDFETHLRYVLEANAATAGRERRSTIRRVERALNTLPDALLTSLPAGPDNNWLCFFRQLVQFHRLLTEAEIGLEQEDYTNIVLKMVQLAEAVSECSSVTVNAASMFALLLLQVELHHQHPHRRRASRRKKSTEKKRKKLTPRQKKAPEPAREEAEQN
ncbi:MAG: hypothetical protein IJB00_04190 [Akkermansia sp.]|nr:hypothetical protein [Akkermansia sp.]